MILGLRGGADEVRKLGVRLQARPGKPLLAEPGPARPARRESRGRAGAPRSGFSDRSRRRDSSDPSPAAAADRSSRAGFRRGFAAGGSRHAASRRRRPSAYAGVIDDLRGNEMILDVRRRRAGSPIANAPASATLLVPGPVPNSRNCSATPIGARPRFLPSSVLPVGRAADDVDVEMILQVLADAGQIVRHRDAERAQFLGRPDAGEQQKLRRVDGAAGEQNFLLGARSVPPAPVAHTRRRWRGHSRSRRGSPAPW